MLSLFLVVECIFDFVVIDLDEGNFDFFGVGVVFE